MSLLDKCQLVAGELREGFLGGYIHGVSWHLHLSVARIDMNVVTHQVCKGTIEGPGWRVQVS
jgi:hypothetical protein